MATTNASRLRWQGLAYNISLVGLVLILIFGCQAFYPVLKNYQDSEVPADQIATLDRAWLINRLWEVKSEPPWVLIWELKESTFSDNRVRQFKLKPGNYGLLIESLDRGLSGGIRPYSHLFVVDLKAGHYYRVDWSHERHYLKSYTILHFWIEDLTTGSAVYE